MLVTGQASLCRGGFCSQVLELCICRGEVISTEVWNKVLMFTHGGCEKELEAPVTERRF